MLCQFSTIEVWQANESDCSLRSCRRSLALFMGAADLPVKGMVADVVAQQRCSWLYSDRRDGVGIVWRVLVVKSVCRFITQTNQGSKDI